MATDEAQFDDAMFDFSSGDYATAISKLQALLDASPDHFDAQLALGMAYYRLGDYPRAILEGHKAEKMRPHEQLVHTNLSLFYMKSGDKKTAEHHGLQARIASWKDNMAPPTGPEEKSELQMAQPKAPPAKVQMPDMPWKKKPSPATAPANPPDEPAPKNE